MARLEHKSLPESVHSVLRARILNNELPAGTRLVETTMAAELGVSRSTLREALRQLRIDRLVEISPRRHSVVTRMSGEDVKDACFARYVVEAGALRDAFAGPRSRLREQLQDALADMASAAERGDLSALVDSDTRLHGVVVRASGRRRLLELWQAMDAQMGAVMRSSLDRQGIELSDVVARHANLITLLGEGSLAEADAALYAHYITDSQAATGARRSR